MPNRDVVCNYCGSGLASRSDVSEGDELDCSDCSVTFRVEGPPETEVQKFVVCAHCGERVPGGTGERVTGQELDPEKGFVPTTKEILFAGVNGLVNGDLVDCTNCDKRFVADLRNGIEVERVDVTDHYLRTVPVGGGA